MTRTTVIRRRSGAPRPGPAAWCIGALPVAAIASLVTAPQSVPGVAPTSALIISGVAVARVILAGSITATLGLGVIPLLFSPREQAATRPIRIDAYRAAKWTASAWAISAIASIFLQTADLSGGSRITVSAITTYIGGFGSGQALVVEIAVSAVALCAAVGSSRSGSMSGARILVLCAVVGVLLLVASGHAGGLSQRWHDLATVSLELHVFAAALWTGGLGAIVTLLVADRALLSRALPRYSPLAGGCLAVVAVSGLLNAVVELATKPGTSLIPELLTSDYGRLVILKAVCLVVLAGLGGHVRFRLLPRIREGRATAIVSWVCCELTVMGIAFGLAAVLERSAA